MRHLVWLRENIGGSAEVLERSEHYRPQLDQAGVLVQPTTGRTGQVLVTTGTHGPKQSK